MKKIFSLSMGFLAATAALSPALAASGKTADGCSYQIINGKYLTTCGKQQAAAPAPVVVASATAQEPVSNYGAVPVRSQPDAPRPVVIQQQRSIDPQYLPQSQEVRSLDPENRFVEKEESWERKRARTHQELLDSTYVGATLGSATLTSVSAGSALGLGVVVGTNIDDNFGFELGYAYSSQDLNLRLDSRASADPTPVSSGYGSAGRNDATLRSHLISGEFQGHFTDSYKRLRPYLGAGLGWKASTLEENGLNNTYGSAQSAGSLSQSTLGALASAGVKFRISQAFNFGASFRYFMPVLRQDSKLEAARSNYGAYGIYPESRLTKADDALTGSGQYQILGGIQYLF